MTKKTLRTMIAILSIATALIHFYLNVMIGYLDIVFTANGLGYLALMAAVLYPIPFLAGRERLVHMIFIGYTAVTILAWVAIGDKDITTPLGMIGYADKLIELALIGALWAHMRQLK